MVKTELKPEMHKELILYFVSLYKNEGRKTSWAVAQTLLSFQIFFSELKNRNK